MKKPPKSHMTFNDFFTLLGLILGCIFSFALKNGWASYSVLEKFFVALIAIGSFSISFSRRARYIVGAIFFGVGAISMLYLSATNWEWNIDHILFTALIFCIFSIPCAVLLVKGLENPGVRQRILIQQIDFMSGSEFEQFCAEILKRNGFRDVCVMGGSGDQGVDIIATKGNRKYAIQCKRYSSKLGNTPVQEVFAGRVHYGCDAAVVMTNNYFTDGAIELAKSTGVFLWDRDWIASHQPPKKKEAQKKKNNVHTYDELLPAAIEFVINTGKASSFSLCLELHIGYYRAVCLMKTMEEKGVVSQLDRNVKRHVLISKKQWDEIQGRKKVVNLERTKNQDSKQEEKGPKPLTADDILRIQGEELKWRRQQIVDGQD